MFQEFSQLLEGRVNQDVYDGYFALTVSLEKYQAVLYKDRLDHLFNMAGEYDRETLADEVMLAIDNQVTFLLAQMEITLDLSQVTAMETATILDVLLFSSNDNDEEALAAINQAEDNEEAFMELLAVYTGEEPERYMPMIVAVAVNTIGAIRDKLERNLSYEEGAQGGLEEIVKRLHHHQLLVGDVPTVAMESLHQGDTSEWDVSSVVSDHAARLIELPPHAIADELISMVLKSPVEEAAVLDEVMHHAESFIDDLVIIQKVRQRCKSRLTEMGYPNE